MPITRAESVAFASRGIANIFKLDLFSIGSGSKVNLIFESKNSPWRQGVFLKTNLGLIVYQTQCPAAILWFDTSPRQIPIVCNTTDGNLIVYNIWDKGSGKESQAWTSGMKIEELNNGRRYSCNDIGFDTHFDKLIFRIEHVK